MSKKIYWVTIAVIMVVAVLYGLQNRKNQALRLSDFPDSTETSLQKANQTGPQESGTELDPHEVTTAQNVSAEFRSWVAMEAQQVAQSVGTQEKEVALKDKALNFSSAEIQYLKQQSLSLRNTAHERILSTYLLTLTPETSLQALADIAAAPLKHPGNFAIHSPEEVLSLQEKSLRRMAIDTIVKNASVNEKSQKIFKDTVAKVIDPTLKEYMERQAPKGP